MNGRQARKDLASVISTVVEGMYWLPLWDGAGWIGVAAFFRDPDRDIPPSGIGWTLRTTDGRILGGLLAEEGPGHAVLVDQGGHGERVPRAEIDALASTGRSFMPAGQLINLLVT